MNIKKFNVIKARFGSETNWIDVTDKANKDLCHNYFVFSGTHLGDPCPGIKKDLTIEYSINFQKYTTTVSEGDIFGHPCLGSEDFPVISEHFRIIKIMYGSNSSWQDVTSELIGTITQPHWPLTLKSTIDPCFGFKKYFIIVYKFGPVFSVKKIGENEYTPLLNNDMATDLFLEEMSDYFTFIKKLDPEHDYVNLYETMKFSGLSNYSLYNYPNELKQFCGHALNMWQYPIQFVPYLLKIRSLHPQSYLEIGTRFGGTYAFTVEYLKKFCGLNRSVALDLSFSPFVAAYSEYNNKSKSFIGDSHETSMQNELLQEGPFDLIFIDGDHSTQGCLSDIDFAIKNSRIFAVHDICDCFYGNGVPAAWEYFKDNNKDTWDIYEYTAQYQEFNKSFLGIGLAVKRKV